MWHPSPPRAPHLVCHYIYELSCFACLAYFLTASQMVELRETGNIMADMARMMTSSAGGQKANGALINAGQKKPPELKATLYTWRERLPNKWDALKEWDDIFCWRTEV